MKGMTKRKRGNEINGVQWKGKDKEKRKKRVIPVRLVMDIEPI